MKLFKTHKLTFTFETGGEYNLDGDWTDGVKTNRDIWGSLQSMRKGSDLMKLGSITQQLPEGYHAQDAKAFYTKEDVSILDADNNVSPAETVINNKTYKVWRSRDNTGFGLAADHWVIVLIKKAKANSGGW